MSKQASGALESFREMGLSELLDAGDAIERVRREDAFASVSADENEIIRRRVEQQQRAFAEFQKREKKQKIYKIMQIHSHLTAAEAELGLAECEANEDEAVVSFVDPEFLHMVRKRIAQNSDESKAAARSGRAGYQRRIVAGAAASPERHQRSNPTRVASSDSKRVVRTMRISLDTALAQGSMEGWSSARVRCFDQIDTNPNAYYYRFNRPGEKQGTGVFSEQERERFFARLAEVGADGKWGLFALKMPGRVGYQCANFYRQLLARGEIVDDNYMLDDKGKFKFVGKHRRVRTHVSHHALARVQAAAATTAAQAAPAPAGATSSFGEADAAAEPAGFSASSVTLPVPVAKRRKLASGKPLAALPQRKRVTKAPAADGDGSDGDGDGGGEPRPGAKRKRRGGRKAADDDDEILTDFEWKPSVSYYSTKRLRGINPAQHGPVINPLPGFRDPITLEDAVMPAISPSGHVMGHDTWRQCLFERGKCPFTNKELSLRDLVLLTPDNIDEYRGRIVNL